MIKITSLHKSFGSNRVIQNLNIDIEEKITTVIIGKSGIGKSVLLKLICALIPADSGYVLIDGEKITGASRTKIHKLRSKIGMLFQDGALFDSFNVYENVAFPLVYHHLYDKKTIDKKVMQYLELVEMQDFATAMPHELSGGMKRKVAIARAMIMEPKYLLYDEPTTGLDPYSSAIVEILIKRLQDELNITSLIVTHDIELTDFIANRIALLENGRIVAYENKEESFKEGSLIYKHFIANRKITRTLHGY